MYYLEFAKLGVNVFYQRAVELYPSTQHVPIDSEYNNNNLFDIAHNLYREECSHAHLTKKHSFQALTDMY